MKPPNFVSQKIRILHKINKKGYFKQKCQASEKYVHFYALNTCKNVIHRAYIRAKTFWIHSLLKIMTCECTTARINKAKPSTIDAWQCFSSNILDYIKEGPYKVGFWFCFFQIVNYS